MKIISFIKLVPDFGGRSLDTGPKFSDIGTFAVLLLGFILMETDIKWVPHTSSDKDAVCRIGLTKTII